jgi:hypothetical protein
MTFGWEDVKDRRAKGGQRPGARSRLGIERKVRFHDLRHTCASHLVMGTSGRRWSIEEVSKLLGHSDIQVTQRYAHLADTALHRAAAETAPSNHPKKLPRRASEGSFSNSAYSENASDNSELEVGAGDESRTHDLQHGKRKSVAEDSTRCGALGGSWADSILTLVRELAAQVAQREPVRDEQAIALACAVLGSESVRLASAVLAAPPAFRSAARVTELEHASSTLSAGWFPFARRVEYRHRKSENYLVRVVNEKLRSALEIRGTDSKADCGHRAPVAGRTWIRDARGLLMTPELWWGLGTAGAHLAAKAGTS